MKKISVITLVFICLIVFVSISKTTQSGAIADEFVYLPIIQKPENPYWSKIYADQSYEATAKTNDGGTLVLIPDGSFGFSLAKLDANGNPVWEKTGSSYLMDPRILTELDDGTIAIAGQALVAPHSNNKLWVAKFSNTGDLIWQKGYFHANQGGGAFALTATSNGGVAVAGYKDNDSETDFLILNLDENGSVIWQKTFGGSETDLATVIKTTPDHGFIVAGYTYSFGSLPYTWVIKLNSQGNLVWQKMLEGESSRDLIKDLTVTPDGSSYFIGRKTNASNLNIVDWWVFKLDSSGNLVWSNTYANESSDSNEGYSIFATDNNNIYMTGFTGTQHQLVNLDQDGNIRWHKAFDHNISIVGVGNNIITLAGLSNDDFSLSTTNLSGDVTGCSIITPLSITVTNIEKRIQTTAETLGSSAITIEDTAYSVTDTTFPDAQLVCGG